MIVEAEFIERVKKGYEVSGLKPKSGVFVRRLDNEQFCGCAISAVLIGEGHCTVQELRDMVTFGGKVIDRKERPLNEIVRRVLGMDDGQMWEFIDGFDGNKRKNPTVFNDAGHAVRKAVLT